MLNTPYQTPCVVHIPLHTPVAPAPPMQQFNEMHRHVTCTDPVISLMTYTVDDIEQGNTYHNYLTRECQHQPRLSGLSPYAAYALTYCFCTYLKVKRADASKCNYTSFNGNIISYFIIKVSCLSLLILFGNKKIISFDKLNKFMMIGISRNKN